MKFKKILGPDQTNKEAVTRQRPPADKYAPIVDNHCLGKRSFVAVARKAEAVTQISGSFSLV